jgi:hypothetical protein
MSAEAEGEFVSEEISPVPGTGDAGAMSRGEPGLPRRFAWRGREYRVVAVERRWKTTGPCRSGGGETYLRRHWYRVRTDGGARMTLYCTRQPTSRRRHKARWFLYTIEPGSP